MARGRRWKRGASGETPRPEAGSEPARRAGLRAASALAHAAAEGRDDWTLPWSDLMLSMFILFLTLYALQLEGARARDVFESARVLRGGMEAAQVPPAEARDGQGDPISGNGDAERTRWNAREAQATRDTALAGAGLEEQSAYRLILTGDVLFENGSADLKPEADQVLQQAADWIGPTPHQIAVAGHTDSLPMSSDRFPSNWELSAARAAGVARFLIDELRVPAERVFVTGHAANDPLASNGTPEGRSRNRRVEIVVTRELPVHRRATGSGG